MEFGDDDCPFDDLNSPDTPPPSPPPDAVTPTTTADSPMQEPAFGSAPASPTTQADTVQNTPPPPSTPSTLPQGGVESEAAHPPPQVTAGSSVVPSPRQAMSTEPEVPVVPEESGVAEKPPPAVGSPFEDDGEEDPFTSIGQEQKNAEAPQVPVTGPPPLPKAPSFVAASAAAPGVMESNPFADDEGEDPFAAVADEDDPFAGIAEQTAPPVQVGAPPPAADTFVPPQPAYAVTSNPQVAAPPPLPPVPFSAEQPTYPAEPPSQTQWQQPPHMNPAAVQGPQPVVQSAPTPQPTTAEASLPLPEPAAWNAPQPTLLAPPSSQLPAEPVPPVQTPQPQLQPQPMYMQPSPNHAGVSTPTTSPSHLPAPTTVSTPSPSSSFQTFSGSSVGAGAQRQPTPGTPSSFKPFVPFSAAASVATPEAPSSTNSSIAATPQPQPASSAPAYRGGYTFTPSPVVVMGFGGRVIVASGGHVTHTTLATQLTSGGTQDNPGTSHVRTMAALTGPAEQSAKADVLSKGLTAIPPTPLSNMMKLLLQKPFEWAKGLPELAQCVEGNISASTPALHPEYEVVPAEYLGTAVAEIQSFVAQGDRQQAVRCALHYRQYDHAMLIAMMCDKETYDNVVNTMVAQTLSPTAPLASIYRVFSGINVDRSDVQAWQSHVKMVLTNDTPSTAEELIGWGDTVAQATAKQLNGPSTGPIDAAHFCYLAAQLKPVPKNNARVVEMLKNKFTILGGVHRRDRCRSTIVRPEAIFMTEVMEYTRQKENSHYIRQSLLPYRLSMAILYLELGLQDRAQGYLDQLLKVLPSTTQRAKGDNYPRTLPQAVSEWKNDLSHSKAVGQNPGAGAAGSRWWPFGGSSGASSAKGTRAMTPNPTSGTSAKATGTAAPPAPPQTSASGSFAASAAVSSAQEKRAASVSPSTSASANQAGKTHSASSTSPEPEGDGEGAEGKKRGGWGSWLRFGKKKKDDDVKQMILDDAPVETDEHGNYKFEQTEEEKAIAKQIKAGPPKLPMGRPATGSAPPPAGVAPMPPAPQPAYGAPPVPPTTASAPPPPSGVAATPFVPAVPGGPPPMMTPGAPGGMPPPPPGPPRPGAGGPPTQARYVDMFNQ